MSFEVIPTTFFESDAKALKKRHRSLAADLTALVESLQKEPTLGTLIAPDIYKIRLAIKSKGRGKSGGARVFTYVYLKNHEVYLLGILDKSDAENLSASTINFRLSRILNELL